jgi:hypothetical protein
MANKKYARKNIFCPLKNCKKKFRGTRRFDFEGGTGQKLPVDFRISLLKFAFSRLKFAWVSPGVV